MPSELVTILDPSPADNPVKRDTVRIPYDQIASRVYELPPPWVEIGVVEGHGFAEATLILAEMGRTWRAVEPTVDRLEMSGDVSNRLWMPPAALEEFDLGVPGTALCLGCGSGREAVWLAERGWAVTAIDRLPDALEMGKSLEIRYPGPIPIDWQCKDLRNQPVASGPFDLCCQFYFYSSGLEDHYKSLLKPGGKLLLEHFYKEQGSRTAPATAIDVDVSFEGLTVEDVQVIERPDRTALRLVAIRE